MNKAKIAGVLLILLSFAGFAIAYNMFSFINDDTNDTNGGGVLGNKYIFTCNIDIYNGLTSNPQITGYDCKARKANTLECLFNEQSILSNKGNLKLYIDNNEVASTKYDIYETQTDTFQLLAKCPLGINAGNHLYSIKLWNENMALFDHKEGGVNLQ